MAKCKFPHLVARHTKTFVIATSELDEKTIELTLGDLGSLYE
jgi:hypothetical protein